MADDLTEKAGPELKAVQLIRATNLGAEAYKTIIGSEKQRFITTDYSSKQGYEVRQQRGEAKSRNVDVTGVNYISLSDGSESSRLPSPIGYNEITERWADGERITRVYDDGHVSSFVKDLYNDFTVSTVVDKDGVLTQETRCPLSRARSNAWNPMLEANTQRSETFFEIGRDFPLGSEFREFVKGGSDGNVQERTMEAFHSVWVGNRGGIDRHENVKIDYTYLKADGIASVRFGSNENASGMWNPPKMDEWTADTKK